MELVSIRAKRQDMIRWLAFKNGGGGGGGGGGWGGGGVGGGGLGGGGDGGGGGGGWGDADGCYTISGVSLGLHQAFALQVRVSYDSSEW